MIRTNTMGKAFPQVTYDHMAPMQGDPYDPTSELHSIIVSARIKRELPPTIPIPSDFV